MDTISLSRSILVAGMVQGVKKGLDEGIDEGYEQILRTTLTLQHRPPQMRINYKKCRANIDEIRSKDGAVAVAAVVFCGQVFASASCNITSLSLCFVPFLAEDLARLLSATNSLSYLSIRDCQINGAVDLIEDAVRNNITVSELGVNGKLNNKFRVSLLKGLKGNTTVKSLFLGAQGKCCREVEDLLTRSTSIETVLHSDDASSSTKVLCCIFRGAINNPNNNLREISFAGKALADLATRDLFEVFLTNSGVQELDLTAPFENQTLKPLLQLVTASALQTVDFGFVRGEVHLRQLASAIPSLAVKDLRLDAVGDFPDSMPELFLQKVEQNYKLEDLRCSEFFDFFSRGRR